MISVLDAGFSQLNDLVDTLKPSKIFILCDENTHEYCLPALLGNLETDIPYEILEIEPGEDLKNLTTAAQLWDILAEFGADRKALVLNVGGGVITDMGGFVASTYKRGIRFVNIPTSLLAMCDASIGGKTGIDHLFLKNIVGTFALPEEILVYPHFLKTLPFDQLRSGFAEMLKHGLIADKKHWEDLTSIDQLTPDAVAPFTERSMQIKQQIVEQDFKEQNVRKTLNFGHTIGHAVESLFLQKGNLIPHGEAVALGMMCETHLALLEKLIIPEDADAVMKGLRTYYPYISIAPFSNEEILTLMQNDKKNTAGNIHFSLITQIGACTFDHQCPLENIILSLDFYRNL